MNSGGYTHTHINNSGFNQTHHPSSAPSLTILIQHTEWVDQGHPRTAPGQKRRTNRE